MLTPAVLDIVLPFYGVSNAPAESLTRNVPQGVDVDILQLGSGDVWNVLYTAYHEQGLPPRKVDITSCIDIPSRDVEDAIIARNVLFLTLLATQDEGIEHQLLWNVYHHLYLDEETARSLQQHVNRLMFASISLKDWKKSEFGGIIRFGTSFTLASVRHVWHAYAESLEKKNDPQWREEFQAALKHSENYQNTAWESLWAERAGTRATAPTGVRGLKIALGSWWERGTYGQVPATTSVPNPLFAATLSQHSVLHHGANPILNYHLGAASSQFTGKSPLGEDNGTEDSAAIDLVAAAQAIFAQWCRAFAEAAPGNMILRFVAASSLSFCQTLQHHLGTGQLSGHFYRRQLAMERLELDPDEYATESKTPKRFDVIDTSVLSDYLGTLNIIASGAPLLKSVPWATLYTRTKDMKLEGAKTKFEGLMCGPFRTISTLLGISPVEYWTNATAVSSVDEQILDGPGNAAVQWCMAWKSHEQLGGRTGRLPPLNVDIEALAELVHTVYRAMLSHGDLEAMLNRSEDPQVSMVRKYAYPTYHEASLVALIRRLLQTLNVSMEAVCLGALEKIDLDDDFMFGQKFRQALSSEMSIQGLVTLPSPQKGTPLFSGWSNIPNFVAVTICVPAAYWKKVAKVAHEAEISFAVEASLSNTRNSVSRWHNIHSNVHVTLGSVSGTGDRQGEESTVFIDEDRAAWSGDSDLIVTFFVSAEALSIDPQHTKASVCLQTATVPTAIISKRLPELGRPSFSQPVIIYETDLEDDGHVYITKNPPGLEDFPRYNNWDPKAVRDPAEDNKSAFTADIDFSGGLNTITGRLDISSPEGKRLLAEQAAVEVRKTSTFIFEIVLGEREAVYQLCFPIPVVKDGSKTRVSRKSAYVEVVARAADPATAQSLDCFIFPCVLAKPDSSSANAQPIPVPLNIPHLSLDHLPVLDVSDKKRVGFLTTLTSWMFSARERKLREQVDDSGMVISPRINFKESLFTMFMLASGLQGGQTGLFAIHNQAKGGIHMLFFVSAIRVDGENASVALDAAVIPFTLEIIKGGELEDFLLILRELECCTITVDDEELVLWKKVLPALVERCRDWTHMPECEYAQPGATVPLSTEPGPKVLCSCGAGKLPKDFVSLPEWDIASQFATRVAISPVYALPFVEDVVDPELVEKLASSHLSVQGDETLRCRNCGDVEAKGGGALKKCMRCLKARYCSVECQKKDWKKHRMECSEAEGIR